MELAARYMALSMLFCVAAQSAHALPVDDDSNVLPPFGHAVFCLQYPRDCAQTESTEALPISLAGRWRKMNLVNTSVNTAIAPKPDPDQVRTHWLIAPLEGNCNAYAVTKRHELLKAGWPSSSLLLAEVTLISTGEHHLILIVKGAKADWVLDNLNTDIVRFAATRDAYARNRIESADNPLFWTNSFTDLN
jgi:predicted transglutaminase-like cysteine proteinase